MQESQINDFLRINKHFLDKSKTLIIKERLEKLDESKIPSLSFIQFRDPRVFLAISWFGGTLGLDRFLIGDIGIGLLKLFLNIFILSLLFIIDLFFIQMGLFQIFLNIFTLFNPSIIDLFFIQKRIHEKNFIKLLEII